MAKITALEAKTYQGKPSGFKVTLDNGQTGNLQEKESDKGLRVGDDVIVTLIPYTSKAGVTSNLLGLRLANTAGTTVTHAPLPAPPPMQTSPQPQQGAVKPPMQQGLYSASKSISEMKHDMRLKALETLGMLAAGGKIEPDEIIEIFNKFYPALDSSYDVLNK